MDYLKRLWVRVQGERGASLVEYVLLVTFIAIAAVTAVAFFGIELADNYSSVATTLP